MPLERHILVVLDVESWLCCLLLRAIKLVVEADDNLITNYPKFYCKSKH